MAITKTIKDWVFKTFYKDRIDLIQSLKEDQAYWELKYAQETVKLQAHIHELENVQQPSMADLMRDSLGVHVLNFAKINKQGLPQHPLDAAKQIRDYRISQLAMVFSNETFQLLCDYLVDVQGNFMVRTANGDLQVAFGRGSINGIETVRSELSKAQSLYEEANSPPEEYDEHAPI